MRINIIFFVLCALLGYGLGQADFTTPEPETVEMSSETTPVVALNKYENLMCPTEEEYQRLAKQVNLEIPEGPSVDVECGDGQRAILSKALHLMNQLKFNFPEEWPEVLRHNLSNSFQFLKERSSKLTLDLNQKDSVAYNKVLSKEIYLGGRFFTYDPLIGVAILVHEARHSEPQADSHVACDAGDIPRSPGACDQVFSKSDKETGAYGYGTLFNIGLALYGEGLAKSDREFAMIDALVELSNRFNVIPEVLARKVDVLAILTDNHEIKLVHPFLGYAVPVNVKFDDEKERPERIEFSPQHNGLFIYTSANKVWSWSPIKGLSKFYPDLLNSSVEVMDVARTKIPWEEMTLFYIRTAGNKLNFVEYSPQENKVLLKPYPTHRGREPRLLSSRFKRTFLALYDESVFLTENGKLYFAPHYGSDPAFGEVPEFQSPQGWISGTGGVIYDGLYLIDGRGDLKVGSFEFVTDEKTGIDHRAFSLKSSELKFSRPLKKYAQGLSLQMALNNDGDLYAWNYKDNEPYVLPLSDKVFDFVVTQVPEVARSIGKVYPENAHFVKACGIITTVDDPWMQRGIGYDTHGNLIMAGGPGAASPCIRVPKFDLKKAIPYLPN
ncbi:hypothetical protein D3C87_701430 [compost metagenome]